MRVFQNSPLIYTLVIWISFCDYRNRVCFFHKANGWSINQAINEYISWWIEIEEELRFSFHLLTFFYFTFTILFSQYDSGDEECDESGGDCVVCMNEQRDTLILPCRHLCLCSPCAENIRFQASNCPICRSPFRALLQVRALQKREPGTAATSDHAADDEDNIPAGYEVVPLTEALNGPPIHHLKYQQPKQSPTATPPTVIKPVAVPRSKKRSKKYVQFSYRASVWLIVQSLIHRWTLLIDWFIYLIHWLVG